ncbi:hypothetical protein VOLCADRAFT_108172 [Volvox carteri f. nagariensis]|uniref:BRX domain-containing protein n=1 Tax=Volvox carteri f. nagariensis TaxID=3068 RepID=D8UIQ5_VOLCA|nr:uncharacterized protein VOLCADRAFT_108172 [Volvox carteri f. nagariensis]EFJ40397.1 hypothetical protein VOLCADRAFT_108172 [Volvox carteri f. nagariensis]|eukprot:XP_002958548.1 hypothetical protein VOLCADRAFT_108172 [Volvox carteri f. nagariensis]
MLASASSSMSTVEALLRTTFPWFDWTKQPLELNPGQKAMSFAVGERNFIASITHIIISSGSMAVDMEWSPPKGQTNAVEPRQPNSQGTKSHKAFVEAAAKARQHLLEFATVAEEDEFPLGTFGLCPWKVVHQRCWYILDLGGKSRILQWLWLRPSGLITTDSAVNPGPHRARSRLEPQVLAQQTPGSGAVIAAARDDRLAEAVGSSVSTMDSSYTAEASVSSELSPSGIVTTSPGMPHGVQLPYTISEALPPISPPAPQQQQLPFAAHHTMSPPQQQYQPQPQHQPQYQHQYQLQQHQHPLQPQHQQLTTLQASTLPPQQQPQQPQAWHTSLGPILTTQEPMARAQVAAMAAGGPGPGPSGPGNSTGRSRESSASMWAPPLPIAVGGVASGHGAMRAYGMHSDGAAAAVANAAVAVAGPHAAAVNMPVGPGLHSGGSRGSRGHSRHASYDSIDVNSRDGDGVSQRGNSGGVGGGAAVDARATPFVLYGGGAAATAPPPPAPLQRIAADPTSDLLQQNLQLQRELELLRQQVALFTQPSVTGRVAGSLAAVAGPGAPPGPMSAPPSSNRHKRSASIDVSSLIATRDGIGPAKDYLAPAASQSPAAASHAPQGHLSPERRSPLARDGGTGTGTGTGNFMMGHKTAPPALEALRQNHPGMSLAQARIAADPTSDLLQQNLQLQRELELLRQQVALFTQAAALFRNAAVSHGAGSATVLERAVSKFHSISDQRRPGPPHLRDLLPFVYQWKQTAAWPLLPPPLVLAGAGARVGPGAGGGAGAPIWRRRNAFVEWANTMHHEMVVEEQPPGGSSASGGSGGGSGSGNGSGSGVPGGGMPGHGNTMAGGAGGTEQHASSSSGYNVPLALAADTLPPEGVQFQYAPGVYITLKPPAQKGGPVRLVKVRFNRKMFTEQSQGQAWWNMHRATLAAMYELTFDMGNKGDTGGDVRADLRHGEQVLLAERCASPFLMNIQAPVAPSSSPPGLPPLAPGSHGTVPPAAMHTRGMSTDTQGTSAGSTAASGSSSMYFSVPVSNSPLHGGAATGAAGGGDLVTGSAGAMWRSVASAIAGGGGGGGGAGGGGDFDMTWTELNYDSQAMMVLPPPPPVGTMGVAGSPAMLQRRDHSRNSSRTASGGSSHAGVSRPPSQPCPESPVFALQQFGSGGSGSAGGVGVGVGGDGGGGGGGPLYPATASALATAAAAAAAQPYYPSHQRAQSGGESSGRS